MEFMATLLLTLANRFDDPDEIRDISRHGIMGGYSGFLYTYEINEFYNEFEDEIENYFYEIFGDGWLEETGASKKTSLDEVRCYLVWSLVEMYCNDKYEEMEEATFIDEFLQATSAKKN